MICGLSWRESRWEVTSRMLGVDQQIASLCRIGTWGYDVVAMPTKLAGEGLDMVIRTRGEPHWYGIAGEL
jgi:hypothetical protein